MLVERIDEVDEAARLVAEVGDQRRHLIQQHHVIMGGDGEVIGIAQGFRAQLVEIEPGDAAMGIGDLAPDVEAPALHGQMAGERRLVIRHAGKGLAHLTAGKIAQGVVIDAHVLEARHAVVAGAVQLQNVQPVFQESDEGQELVALQATLIEVVRRPVRGRHHDDAMLEEGGEEPPQDHRIGDIGDVEFVKADKRAFAGDLFRECGDKVDLLGFLLPPVMQLLMHFQHEGVEMHAALLLHLNMGEEQIHQHRLAATDPAIEIETLRRRLILATAKAEALCPAGETAGRLRAIGLQGVVE